MEHVSGWQDQVKSDPAITDSDAEELKSHILDLVETLKSAGLDEEEAFWVACKRMGNTTDWGEEYRQENNPVIQIRRSLLILAGVLAYFLCYYFILSTSKLLFIALLFNESSGYKANEWVMQYLISWHFLVLLFFISTFLLEKKAIAFIEEIKMKPRHTIILLTTTVFLAIVDTCLYPVVKGMMGDNQPLRSQLHHFYLYFDFSFPLLISLGFVFIYFRYNKLAKF